MKRLSALTLGCANGPATPSQSLCPTPWPNCGSRSHHPPRIGLFLPLSGALAPAGKALRDGFFSAYLHDPATTKPQVRLYDTAAEAMPALYRRSREEGVAFIIGPLDRRP